MTHPDWCPKDVWELVRDRPAAWSEVIARAILAERERCPNAIATANLRLANIDTPLMGGDNLAITLCTHFDDVSPSDDDTGWSEAAIAGYEEVIAAIKAHYTSAIRGTP